MIDLYACSQKDFLKSSKIPVRVLENEAAIYEEISRISCDQISVMKGQQMTVICPVGPIGQYPLLAERVNQQSLSLKNVTMINMDEYLDESGRLLDPSHPLSFQGTMDRLFYSQVRPELLMPDDQRIFPQPGHEGELDTWLESHPADLCLTSVGINGHIAFNEPPDESTSLTDEAFGQVGTRCIDLARDTIVNNGARKVYGALDLMPRRCITLGMKQLLSCRMIKIYLYCDWHWGIMRKIALGPVTRQAPASYLQLHPNAEMVITRSLLDTKLSLPG